MEWISRGVQVEITEQLNGDDVPAGTVGTVKSVGPDGHVLVILDGDWAGINDYYTDGSNLRPVYTELATIELDHGAGRGALYWRDGYIWCRIIKTGEHEKTGIMCPDQHDASELIELSYGTGGGVWDLGWID